MGVLGSPGERTASEIWSLGTLHFKTRLLAVILNETKAENASWTKNETIWELVCRYK